ncbi:TetR/AcrR family transcriptional regulator [Paraburkholderia sp. RP-4-7]|uniref:TetR/AcrR family transcriptional regulator n=2 Tax=Paraburkholderia polaris TaxID=2728848 RepID=A0A848IYS3_9BURK|nr:TetR/AcrR family transcriptional regulator [Paraburkholderia polaris]
MHHSALEHRATASGRTLQEDHRTIAARKKRDAMRVRILNATMEVFAERKKLSTSIEDVVKAADISRGTFYKHFASLEEALIAVGKEVTDRMTLDILPVYDVLTDPLQRVSTGMRLFLARALTDRRWAGFVVRAELIPHESILLDYIYHDLRAGAAEAKLHFDDVTAAADSVMGATVEGMRTIMLGRSKDPQAYISSVIRITLRGLGVPYAAADVATAFSHSYLMAQATGTPGYLSPAG